MANRESYRDIVDRIFGSLNPTNLERKSLLLAIQRLDEGAQSLGIDVVAELREGHTLNDIFEMIAERQQKRSSLNKFPSPSLSPTVQLVPSIRKCHLLHRDKNSFEQIRFSGNHPVKRTRKRRAG